MSLSTRPHGSSHLQRNDLPITSFSNSERFLQPSLQSRNVTSLLLVRWCDMKLLTDAQSISIPNLEFNMRFTSVLSFIVATMAASALAAPLENAEAGVTDVSSVEGAGNVLAQVVCGAPVDPFACREYCGCGCTGATLLCFENPVICPARVLGTCVASCSCQ